MTKVGPSRSASGWVLPHQTEVLAHRPGPSIPYSSPEGVAHVSGWDRVSLSRIIQTRTKWSVVLVPGNRCKPGLPPASGRVVTLGVGTHALHSAGALAGNSMDDYGERWWGCRSASRCE